MVGRMVGRMVGQKEDQKEDQKVDLTVAVKKARGEGHSGPKVHFEHEILPHCLVLKRAHLLPFSAILRGRQTPHRVDFRREHLFVLLLIVQQMFFFPPSITPHTGHMARLK
jgi:hypothetical protein